MSEPKQSEMKESDEFTLGGKVVPIDEALEIQGDASDRWVKALRKVAGDILKGVKYAKLAKDFAEFTEALNLWLDALDYNLKTSNYLGQEAERLRSKVSLGCLKITGDGHFTCFYCGKPAKYNHTIDAMPDADTHLGDMNLCGNCHKKRNNCEFHRLISTPVPTPVKEAVVH